MLAALRKMALNPREAGERITFSGGSIIPATGQLTTYAGFNVDKLKQAYAAALVENTAREFGFNVETTAQNELEITSQF